MPAALLRDLEARGVTLGEGSPGVLRVTARPEVLTEEDWERIRDAKPALLALLNRPARIAEAEALPDPRERLLALGELAGYPTLHDRGYVTLLAGEEWYGKAARRRTEGQVEDLIHLLTQHPALAGEEA